MQIKPEETLRESTVSDSSTVKRILHNALDHFSRFGYAGASVREITHASEVTKPTLYYYFKNKEELYKKLADTCFEEILGVIRNASDSQGSTVERALNVINQYGRLCDEKPCVTRFVHLMFVAAERQAPDVGVHRISEHVREVFKKVVNDGVSRNEVKAERAEAAVHTLVALFTLRIWSVMTKLPNNDGEAVLKTAVANALS